MPAPLTVVHLRMKVKGKAQNISTFFQLVRSIDWDFPLGNGRVPEYSDRKYEQCEDCGGMVWKGPLLTSGELDRAAKQCNVTLKLKGMKLEEKCREEYSHLPAIITAIDLMVN